MTDVEPGTEWVVVVVDSNPRPWPEPEALLAHGASEYLVREYRLLRDYFEHMLPRFVMESRN